MPTHYETLGISKDANETEIKKAYRTLSLKYHPDRNPDPSVQETYKAINDAYDVLSDPQTKQQYDHEVQFGQGFHPMGHGGDGMADINNIFNMMFGGGFPGMGHMNEGFPGGPGVRIFHSGFPGAGGGFPGGGGFPEHIFQQFNKPASIIKNVEITLEQVYHGATVQVEIDRQVTRNMMRHQENLKLSVTVPQGIDDNEVMIIRGQGHSISDDICGDVKIVFSIKNDTIFKRQGQDLVYLKHLTLKESLCGFAFEIQHINGKTLNMNNLANSAIIKPNFKKVVPGLGLVKNGQTGNLIIELMVDFPDSLTKEQIDKLRDIL
jgi:molecular chaperone DnaJ